MDESTLDMKGGPPRPVLTSADSPPAGGEEASGRPNAAHASPTSGSPQSPLPRVATRLDFKAIRSCLDEANRRGRLPEITWPARDQFAMTLPSRPLLTKLSARLSIEPDEDARVHGLEDPRAGNGAGSLSTPARRIEFELAIHRVLWHSLIWFTVASALIGPWLTERFSPWPLYSWWWYPALCVVTALWIALRWPAMSLADADPLARERIEVIRQRLTETV